MKITKAVAVLALGGLAACANGGDLEVGGLKYNSFSNDFSGLDPTVISAIPSAGTATYLGSYSGSVDNGATVQGAATMSADFTARAISLSLAGPAFSKTMGAVIAADGGIVPTVGPDVVSGGFFGSTGEVAAGRYESVGTGLYGKGQFIVERATPCTGGTCL